MSAKSVEVTPEMRDVGERRLSEIVAHSEGFSLSEVAQSVFEAMMAMAPSTSCSSLHDSDLIPKDSISLRDQFAMAALTGLMAGRWQSNIHGARHDAYTVDAPRWAENAYAFADAMLAERKKQTIVK